MNMEKKNQWKAMTSLASVLTGNGLTIFGSFVSSQIIHNDHAERFYEVAAADQYNDPDCHPELSGRFVVPGDIDVICNKEQYKAVMEFMRMKYHVRHVRKVDMAYRSWMCRKGEYYLYTTEVICIVSQQFVNVSLDFVVQCKGGVLDLPNKVDCDVNGLLLSANGLKIHKSVRDFYPRCVSDTNLLIKVISKILKRECTARAVIERAEDVFDVIPERRLMKLRLKGYKIFFKYEQVHFIPQEEQYDGECTICIQPLTGSSCKFSGCDCNYRFCVSCMAKAVEEEVVSKCPMCRTDVNVELAKIDMAVFDSCSMHTPSNVYKMRAKYLF
jgi:hypothetical protein